MLGRRRCRHHCLGCYHVVNPRENPQAATTYAQLLNTQSDNNVKLIVLERLAGLKKHHTKVLQEVLMDILRALSSPNVDICRKTLEVAMDLVTPRNIEEVVQVRWCCGPPPRFSSCFFCTGHVVLTWVCCPWRWS